MRREEVLAALRSPPEGDYVWDGADEDERPASAEELGAALEAYRKRRGRPPGSGKTQITLRVDNDTLAAFRATGPGWQSRMNQVLSEWAKGHEATGQPGG